LAARQAAMKMCAKSWHTPLPCSKTLEMCVSDARGLRRKREPLVDQAVEPLRLREQVGEDRLALPHAAQYLLLAHGPVQKPSFARQGVDFGNVFDRAVEA
jgi:hypothetical protein